MSGAGFQHRGQRAPSFQRGVEERRGVRGRRRVAIVLTVVGVSLADFSRGSYTVIPTTSASSFCGFTYGGTSLPYPCMCGKAGRWEGGGIRAWLSCNIDRPCLTQDGQKGKKPRGEGEVEERISLDSIYHASTQAAPSPPPNPSLFTFPAKSA